MPSELERKTSAVVDRVLPAAESYLGRSLTRPERASIVVSARRALSLNASDSAVTAQISEAVRNLRPASIAEDEVTKARRLVAEADAAEARNPALRIVRNLERMEATAISAEELSEMDTDDLSLHVAERLREVSKVAADRPRPSFDSVSEATGAYGFADEPGEKVDLSTLGIDELAMRIAGRARDVRAQMTRPLGG